MTHIYTDGACLLNTRGDLAIGLCGFYDQTKEVFVIDNKLSFDTNSYIMELKAVSLALQRIKNDIPKPISTYKEYRFIELQRLSNRLRV
jgi:ribonuclease HI